MLAKMQQFIVKTKNNTKTTAFNASIFELEASPADTSRQVTSTTWTKNN